MFDFKKKGFDAEGYLKSVVRRAMRERRDGRVAAKLVPADDIVQGFLEDVTTPQDIREMLTVAVSDCTADAARVGNDDLFVYGKFLLQDGCARAARLVPAWERGVSPEGAGFDPLEISTLNAYSPFAVGQARRVADNLKVIAACQLEGRVDATESKAGVLHAQSSLALAYSLLADADEAAREECLSGGRSRRERHHDAGVSLVFARMCYENKDCSSAAAFARLGRRAAEGAAVVMDDPVWSVANLVANRMEVCAEEGEAVLSSRYPADVRRPDVKPVIDGAEKSLKADVAGGVRMMYIRFHGLCGLY